MIWALICVVLDEWFVNIFPYIFSFTLVMGGAWKTKTYPAMNSPVHREPIGVERTALVSYDRLNKRL